jgi:hypothetical protein
MSLEASFSNPQPDAAVRLPNRKVAAALAATALILQPQLF